MNISSIFGSSAVSSIERTASTTSTSATQTAPPPPPDGDSTSVSGPGKLFAKLQSLEKTDPAKAQQVLSSIADKLKTAASSATGETATKLNDMAAKFQKAADTGDVSGLQPPTPPSDTKPTGGGHRHYAHAKAQQGSDDLLSTLQSAVSSAMSAVDTSSAAAASAST